MPACMMAGTARAHDSSVIERDQEHRAVRGQGKQSEVDLGDDGERALRTDEQLGQVITGDVLEQLAAVTYDFTAGQHGLDAGDEVLGHPVLDGARPARTFREVAAEEATAAAGRVGGIEEALCFHRLLEYLQ